MVPKTKLRKLDARSRESIMAGYAPYSKDCKLWDAKLKKFIILRDAKFDESISAPQSEVPVESELSKSDSVLESIVDESDDK